MEKLIYVLLDPRIDRTSVNIFEGQTELFGIVVLFFELHESAKNSFDLVQRVLRFRFYVHVFVLHFQHSFPKRSYHVKLLHNTVHVADAANVF
jgi:hypothetical protein